MGVLIDAMRLVDADAGEELILWPGADGGGGVWLVDFNPGFPEVRKVQVPNPGDDGASDYTRLHGAKAVALVVRLMPPPSYPGVPGPPAPSVSEALTLLRRWVAPARRVHLLYTPAAMAERVLYLRGEQLGADLPMRALLTGAVEVQLQWSCPDGVEYSAETTETVVKLQSPITTGGRTYPLVYPRTYPEQSGTGLVTVANAGTSGSPPLIRVFGPVTGPVLTNETSGEVFAMAGFVLGPTEYLDIDMAAKTVQLRGEPGANANRRAGVTTPGWWRLRRGANVVRFTATSGSAPSQAVIFSQAAWI